MDLGFLDRVGVQLQNATRRASDLHTMYECNSEPEDVPVQEAVAPKAKAKPKAAKVWALAPIYCFCLSFVLGHVDLPDTV
jgi:hypothetical protein